MFSPSINFFFCPYHNTGAHFVNWSTSYLSGQTHCLGPQDFDLLLMPDSVDCQLKNFHQHRPRKIRQYNQVVEFLNSNHQNSHTDMINLYLLPPPLFLNSNTAFDMKIAGTLHNEISNMLKDTAADISKTLNYIQDHNHSVIMIKFHRDDYLNHTYNDRHPVSRFDGRLLEPIEVLDEWQKLFFSEAENQFESNIWDQREKLALAIRPVAGVNHYDSILNTARPHLLYSTDDIWND